MTHEALVAMAREVCGPFRPERAVDAVGVLAWLAAPGPLVPESERLPLRLWGSPVPSPWGTRGVHYAEWKRMDPSTSQFPKRKEAL